jgi:hypothetical protein
LEKLMTSEKRIGSAEKIANPRKLGSKKASAGFRSLRFRGLFMWNLPSPPGARRSAFSLP